MTRDCFDVNMRTEFSNLFRQRKELEARVQELEIALNTPKLYSDVLKADFQKYISGNNFIKNSIAEKYRLEVDNE